MAREISATARVKKLAADSDIAARILAVMEPHIATLRVGDMAGAARVFASLISGSDVERFAVIALDRRNRVIDQEVLTIGSSGFTVVDPRQIFRWALQQGRSGAVAIILGHNHPSGDPTPSTQDISITKRVTQAGQILGIQVLDHIVIVDSGAYESLAHRGYHTTLCESSWGTP